MKSIFPRVFSAGLTFSASALGMAYPASAGWSLAAMLRGPSTIDLTSTADGNAHVFSASAATTATWVPGTYVYSIRATLNDGVVSVESGNIIVNPDIASIADGTETRSQNRITLDNVNAVLQKKATQDQMRYTINNRELWRTPIADLLKLRALYAALVAQENATASGKSIYGRSVRVRFLDK